MGAIMGHLIRGGSSILHEGTMNARTIMPNAGNQNSDRVYSSKEEMRHPLARSRARARVALLVRHNFTTRETCFGRTTTLRGVKTISAPLRKT